jgi:hypothetical protein
MYAFDPVVMRELASLLFAAACLVKAIWPNGIFH